MGGCQQEKLRLQAYTSALILYKNTYRLLIWDFYWKMIPKSVPLGCL